MKRVLSKTRNGFLGAAIGVAVFAAIYEQFSHQVYSPFLILAFLFPLLGGVLPYTLLLRRPYGRKPGTLARCLYNSGLVTLTAGSIFQGILEIYGTTSRLSAIYWIVGLSLCALGLTAYLAFAKSALRSTGQLSRPQPDGYRFL